MKSKKRKSSCLDENDCDKENKKTVSSISAVPPCLSLVPLTISGQREGRECIPPANALLDLPPPLLYYILSFTSLEDISVLDSAFCTRSVCSIVIRGVRY